jgi:predicted small lipoprotein YifL
VHPCTFLIVFIRTRRLNKTSFLGGTKMKKILALLLALVMVLSLAACGAKEEAKPEAPAAEAPAAEAAPAAETVKVALVIVAGDHGFTGESVKHAELEAAAMNEV